jgi:hypothetical protein
MRIASIRVNAAEWLYPRIEFERRSEGKESVKLVYQRTRSAIGCRKLEIALLTIVNSARALFEKWISIATANGLLWVRATILAREAEYWQKVEYNFYQLRNRWNDLNSARLIEGLPWATLELDELDEIVSNRKQITIQMAELGEALCRSDRPDSYPDFAGQFLHAVGEQLLSQWSTTTRECNFPRGFRRCASTIRSIIKSHRFFGLARRCRFQNSGRSHFGYNAIERLLHPVFGATPQSGTRGVHLPDLD